MQLNGRKRWQGMVLQRYPLIANRFHVQADRGCMMAPERDF